MLMRSTSSESNELTEHGVYTVGTVIGGSSVKVRRGDFTSITIRYKIKDGTVLTGDVDVPAPYFDHYYKGMQVQIKYSALHPATIALANNAGDYKMDNGKVMRPLKLNDLIHLFETKPGTETLNYLNSVNLEWDYQPGSSDNGSIYVNEMKNIALKTGKNEIMYIHSGFDETVFKKDIEALGMHKTSDVIYSNDAYMVVYRKERRKNQGTGSMANLPEYVTLVSVVRK